MRQKDRVEQSAIDLARQVAQSYKAAYVTAKSNKYEALAVLGWPDGKQSISKMAVALTQKEIESTFGQRFQRSAIYRYVRLDGQLSEPIKSLARANRFNLRDLVMLSNLMPDQQHDMAIALTNKNVKAKRPQLALLVQILKQMNNLCRLLEKGADLEVITRQLEFAEFRCVVDKAAVMRDYLGEYHHRALLLLRKKYFGDGEIAGDNDKYPATSVQNPSKKVAQ